MTEEQENKKEEKDGELHEEFNAKVSAPYKYFEYILPRLREGMTKEEYEELINYNSP